jgi:hypothetical protein
MSASTFTTRAMTGTRLATKTSVAARSAAGIPRPAGVVRIISRRFCVALRLHATVTSPLAGRARADPSQHAGGVAMMRASRESPAI